LRHDKSLATDRPAVPVFFLSDSTGISAETMGNAVLIQFPHVGICGQGPSDHPDLADRLLDQGIESMSLNPDSVIDSWTRLAGTAAAQAVREAGTP